jgi:transcriptional regulator with XRE-family HTH domain
MFDLIGETLRRLRKERGKTLEQLGAEAGLGRGQLSRIENARQEATLSTLAKILDSQRVSRREFFRRYDLVEAEAVAVKRASGEATAAAGAEASEDTSRWPEEIREVLGKVESFVHATFNQPRPIAQGAVEVGDAVILFRVVPKSVHREEQEGAAPTAKRIGADADKEPSPPTPARGKKKSPSRR